MIRNPRQFWDLARRGLCGNTPHSWPSVDAYLRDPLNKQIEEVTLATSGTADKAIYYHQHIHEVQRLRWVSELNGGYIDRDDELGFWICDPVRFEKLHVYEAPTWEMQSSYQAFQGEVILSERILLWNVSREPWGREKRAGHYRTAEGLLAIEILKHYLGRYLDHLTDIEVSFPGACIEFTKFGWPLGIFGLPLVIWEVRHF